MWAVLASRYPKRMQIERRERLPAIIMQIADQGERDTLRIKERALSELDASEQPVQFRGKGSRR
jgi:hypothetical protein